MSFASSYSLLSKHRPKRRRATKEGAGEMEEAIAVAAEPWDYYDWQGLAGASTASFLPNRYLKFSYHG